MDWAPVLGVASHKHLVTPYVGIFFQVKADHSQKRFIIILLFFFFKKPRAHDLSLSSLTIPLDMETLSLKRTQLADDMSYSGLYSNHDPSYWEKASSISLSDTCWSIIPSNMLCLIEIEVCIYLSLNFGNCSPLDRSTTRWSCNFWSQLYSYKCCCRKMHCRIGTTDWSWQKLGSFFLLKKLALIDHRGRIRMHNVERKTSNGARSLQANTESALIIFISAKQAY